METRELRYFVAVAEELHFARAAARVGIEQAPLSKAITTLERRLGVQLFIRTRRSTTLTPVGEMLLVDARRILAEVDCARRNIRAAASGCNGRLRIAVCDGVAHPRLARLLAQSREDDPGVDIQIVHSPSSEQLRGLRSGMFDLAFGLHAGTDQDVHDVHRIQLWKDPAVIVVRSDHQLAQRKTIACLESDVGPLLSLGEPSSARSEPLEMWLRRVPANAGGGIEYVPSIELLLTLIAAGYGVGIVSAAQGETINRSDLVLLAVSASGVEIRTFLWQRKEGTSRIVARFRERALKMAAAETDC